MIQPLPQTGTDNELPWSVLHVVANHEKRVVEHLAARELEYYLPLYSESSRRTDRKVFLKRPLFAGYVFVRFVPLARPTILSIPGVLHLLGDGKHETVNAAEIDRIREGLQKGLSLRPHDGIQVGTRVRICEGTFADNEGIVCKLSSQCKVVMELSTTPLHFSVEISRDYLEILEPRMDPCLFNTSGGEQAWA
jgi:transcription antitermination factor NusG